MHENLKRVLEPYSGEWTEKRGVWAWSTVIAERKAFLWQEIRARVEAVANANGYRFDYQVLPVR